MMHINIIALGRMSEKFYSDAMREYEKRLSAYCKINIVELPEARVSDESSQAAIRAALLSEAKQIEKHISKGYNVAMCIEGGELTSEVFAERIAVLMTGGSSRINFIIGSSHGLYEDIKKRSDLRLSVSKMTLPHQLCRVVLLEQIYRAFKINAHESYHK
ncbi:MAG: 23S rRNA (pseudouridine(1915)-N(3))-methyltransferase RlmH [Clostridia bacterium]|nr:23S rRNA (pseudouridine(1915)-N(3))-methyltransferase RlmH [Clostridia bacterium]